MVIRHVFHISPHDAHTASAKLVRLRPGDVLRTEPVSLVRNPYTAKVAILLDFQADTQRLVSPVSVPDGIREGLLEAEPCAESKITVHPPITDHRIDSLIQGA